MGAWNLIGSELQWEVQHYGVVLVDTNHTLYTMFGKHLIRSKIYRYDNEIYVEVMCNGVIYVFQNLPYY